MSEREKFEAHVRLIDERGFPLNWEGQNILRDICRWIAAEEARREAEAAQAKR